jgi:hypothetical protein
MLFGLSTVLPAFSHHGLKQWLIAFKLPSMDGLKDVFTPFYERLRRPFLGAYWIAVFSFNWRVWTALFFYEEQVNGVDKIDFIAGQLTLCNLFLYPVAFALGFILIGALLDVGVFSYQQWIRAWKREIQEKRERDRMVPNGTFLRVREERDQKVRELTQAETEVTNLKGELASRQDMMDENSRLKLVPDMKYFHGKWSVFLPKMRYLTIEFRDGQLELCQNLEQMLSDGETKNSMTRDIRTIERGIDKLLMVFRGQKGDLRKELNEVHMDIIDRHNLIDLFETSFMVWDIPIAHIYKEEFAVTTKDNKAEVIFRRQSAWDDTMWLWSNDTDRRFPLPQR